MKATSSKKGMTLVEILIAAAIGLIVTTGALRFLLQTLKTYQYETGKILVNRDIRKFTTQMIDDATYANYFLIFDQISNLSRASGYTLASGGVANPTSATYKGYTTDLSTTEPDDDVAPPVVGTNYVQSGLPGDVVVFVYNLNGDNTKIHQLIIYYRPIATTANGTTGTNSATISQRTVALKRIVVSITDATAQTAGILKLLPDPVNVPTTLAANNSVIFQYVDGQASDLVPIGSVNRVNKMFFNLNNTSVLVRGRIYENYTAQRLVKSTYNFTVTPRG